MRDRDSRRSSPCADAEFSHRADAWCESIAFLVGLLALLLLPLGGAAAHDARPLSINIAEKPGGLYLVRIRVPPSVDADNRPRVLWPQACTERQSKPRNDTTVSPETILLACPQGLEGRSLTVRYGAYNPSLTTLFRLGRLNGKAITEVLPPDRLTWQVPKDPSWSQVARQYLRLGVEHIWRGIDHLLFVGGLLLLAGTLRRVLLAITGFTIAHSITLSLSALGLVQLPIAPVEAAIALSILFLAREIARPSPSTIARRYPILVSSSFGLLHGFGFAAALREVGLPTNEIATGLLCFNLGVEIGQIAFIAALGILILGVRTIARVARTSCPVSRAQFVGLGAYGLGVPAASWFIQRLASF